MKNKVLIEVMVPQIDKSFDIYIPINKTIGNVIDLLNKAIFDLTDGVFIGGKKDFLYDQSTGEKYNLNAKVFDTNIRNGSSVILL